MNETKSDIEPYDARIYNDIELVALNVRDPWCKDVLVTRLLITNAMYEIRRLRNIIVDLAEKLTEQ